MDGGLICKNYGVSFERSTRRRGTERFGPSDPASMGQIRSGINPKRYSTESVRCPSSGPDLINWESIVTLGSRSNVHPPESQRGIQAKSRPPAPIRRHTGFLPSLGGGTPCPRREHARVFSAHQSTNLLIERCYTMRIQQRTVRQGFYRWFWPRNIRPRSTTDLQQITASSEQSPESGWPHALGEVLNAHRKTRWSSPSSRRGLDNGVQARPQRRSPFLALTLDVNGSSSFDSRYSTSRFGGWWGNAASYKYPGSGSQQPAPDRNQLWWQPGTRLAVPGNSAIF
jgi:hypothetical protein